MWKTKLKKFPIISPITGNSYRVKIKPFRLFWSVVAYEVYIYETKHWTDHFFASGQEDFFIEDKKVIDFISITGIAILNYEEKKRQREIDLIEKKKMKKSKLESRNKFENWNGTWSVGTIKDKEE